MEMGDLAEGAEWGQTGRGHISGSFPFNPSDYRAALEYQERKAQEGSR